MPLNKKVASLVRCYSSERARIHIPLIDRLASTSWGSFKRISLTKNKHRKYRQTENWKTLKTERRLEKCFWKEGGGRYFQERQNGKSKRTYNAEKEALKKDKLYQWLDQKDWKKSFNVLTITKEEYVMLATKQVSRDLKMAWSLDAMWQPLGYQEKYAGKGNTSALCKNVFLSVIRV